MQHGLSCGPLVPVPAGCLHSGLAGFGASEIALEHDLYSPCSSQINFTSTKFPEASALSLFSVADDVSSELFSSRNRIPTMNKV
jgi:hypothetical protein